MFYRPILPNQPGTAHPSGRRGDSRARLFIPGRLVLRDGTIPCVVEDLSRTGARLALSRGPSVDETGILEVCRIEAFGAGVWLAQGRCGFHFDDPLPIEQVIALRTYADHFTQHQRAENLRMAREFVQGWRAR